MPLGAVVQRARIAPAALAPAHVLQLQRTLGNRAVGRLLGRGAAPVQRKQEWKAKNHPDNLLDGFAGALDGAVQAAAAAALEPDSLPDTDGYLKLWKDTTVILRTQQSSGTGIDKPGKERIDNDEMSEEAQAEAEAAKAFAAARYGYAVESLASSDAGLGAALPDGCSYQLQATRGMTRPDVVVTHNVRGEIGWFDITSEGNIGHIDQKTGSGWKTRPYVAEITYPVLDISKIGTGNLTIGERVARRNALRRRVQEWKGLLDKFKGDFLSTWDQNGYGWLDQKGRKEKARETVEQLLGLDKQEPMVIRHVLRAVGLDPNTYGLGAGGSKPEGEAILRDHFGGV